MARRLFKSDTTPETLTEESRELLNLAYRASDSTSNVEDRLVAEKIEALCSALLSRGIDSDIEAALSLLKAEEGTQYDDLLALAEGCAEYYSDKDGAHLLVLIPVLAWSRYKIAFGKMPQEVSYEIAKLYKSHFASPKAHVSIGNSLIAAEHIPERLTEVRSLLSRLVKPKKDASVVDISYLLTADPTDEFSDVRYVVLGVSAETATDLFDRFSSERIELAHKLMDFSLKARAVLREFMTGSMLEVQAPAAFFTAWRQAVASERLFSLKALVKYVCIEKIRPEKLIATTAIFSNLSENNAAEPQPEVRIGISFTFDANRIVAGVVWPCEPTELEIAQGFAKEVLTLEGIKTVVAHDQLFPLEWCEQCGAPLYANPEGNVTHVEKPNIPRENLNFKPTLN